MQKNSNIGAPGPDHIPTKVIIKVCADAIALVLQIIYSQSLESAQDWLSANITPVFKKGNRSTIDQFH